jgi:hypothetical protein
MNDAELIAQAEMSPCVGVCVMDEETGWCFGCGRTAGEIREWQRLDAPTRAALEADLGDRVKTVLEKRRAQRGTKRVSRRVRPPETT